MTSKIDQALAGQLSVDELDGEEQELYFARFSERMAVPSEKEKAFYAQLNGPGDDDGMLAFASAGMAPITGTE